MKRPITIATASSWPPVIVVTGQTACSYREGPPEISYRGGATFARVCPECGRFAKPNKRVRMNGNGPVGTNARCAKHGRVAMPFTGYY